jgi:hypothetical protein
MTKEVTDLFALYATRGAFRMNDIHSALIRKRNVRKACAAFSGITSLGSNKNRLEQSSTHSTYCIKFVAQVNRVDIVALEIREHYDLKGEETTGISTYPPKRNIRAHKEDRAEQKASRHKNCEKIQPA